MGTKYQNESRFLLAVDCIIFGFEEGGLKVLLVKRKFKPQSGKWSLPGGFVKKEEPLHDAAIRILSDLTGMKGIFLEQLEAFGALDRDPEERVISVAYYALIRIRSGNLFFPDYFQAKWFSVNDYPEPIFDHQQMIDMAYEKIKVGARNMPVGFELLQEKFTMRQLQDLYESIYGQSFDRRNFSKKILSTGILQKHNEKDRVSSKKGAFLFSFKKNKYQELLKHGIHLEFISKGDLKNNL